MKNNNIYEVENLHKHFSTYGGLLQKKIGEVRAVDGVSFSIEKNEVLGLVGESGSGKSTVGRLLMGLIEPTEGIIRFKGKNILEMTKAERLSLRKDTQMVFQDPFSSLNPRMPVGDTIKDSLEVLKLFDKKGMERRINEVLDLVGLDKNIVKKYPHEFSGGDRQRIGIATALVVEPDFIFLDEPVSALDVSAQAQILNLIKYIQKELKLTILIVAHDLSVVEYVSDRVAVMYFGDIVEIAPTNDLYRESKHPYTQALMSAILTIDPHLSRKRKEIILEGEIPSPLNIPSGCKFHTRCHKYIGDVCKEKVPALKDSGNSHCVACHLYDGELDHRK